MRFTFNRNNSKVATTDSSGSKYKEKTSIQTKNNSILCLIFNLNNYNG
jgi:hypothetical protein